MSESQEFTIDKQNGSGRVWLYVALAFLVFWLVVPLVLRPQGRTIET